MTAIKFVTPPADEFRRVLRERVDQFFIDNNRSKHWNWVMVVKLFLYIGGYIGGYIALMTAGFGPSGQLACYVLVGFAMAGIGFNIGHDACHNALSRSSRVNRFWSHAFTMVGAHAYNWKIIHNVIHHGFPNIPYADGDLHPVSYLRYFDEAPNKKPHHRYQHIYAFPLYALATLVWVFWKDFLHISRDVHCGHQKRPAPRSEYAILIGSKVFHVVMFLVLPIVLLPTPAWFAIVAFLIMHFVSGLTLASVFAVGHLVEGVDFPMADDKGHIHDSWAAHQLKTTANFSTGSRFFYWTVGGLNYQIEHHLFSSICHVHYRDLAPIVRKTAKEFGLPYHEFPSFFAAQRSHFHLLKQLGAQELGAEPAFP
jgi:linoleoyl-CoA desaturase